MNQILDKNYISNNIKVEFGNDIFEISYEEDKFKYKLLQYLKKNKYKLQFVFSSLIALGTCFVIIFKYIDSNKKEKFSKNLLNNYSLTTLYQNNSYNDSAVNSETPFVIGMIKINKIDLIYPILSYSNEDLLKMSVCRFSGPMPNEIGNLCIVGHNYIDNRFFSRLSELSNGDHIDIYDLNGSQNTYEVYGRFEVREDDLSCTSQNTSGKKIVTLITCNNANNSKRLVIKSKQAD